MIKGSKKWSIYGMLPNSVNRVFIYAPAYYDTIWENKLEDISNYLLNRVDTIGKVVRLTSEEADWFETNPDNLLVVYNGEMISEPFVSNLIAKLKEPELEPPIIELIKLLKNGEDIL